MPKALRGEATKALRGVRYGEGVPHSPLERGLANFVNFGLKMGHFGQRFVGGPTDIFKRLTLR